MSSLNTFHSEKNRFGVSEIKKKEKAVSIMNNGETYEEIPHNGNDCHSGFDGFL